MRRCLALLAVPLIACGDDSPADRATTVRDSAGIRIVESVVPLWQPGEAWRLSAEPVVDIGGGASDEEQLFRVRGAVRLSDGTLVVANTGSFELRYYDAAGGFMRAAGGQGEGPGMFGTGPWAVWKRPGDTLATTDTDNLRVSYFDAGGDFVRAVTLRPEPGSYPGIIGQLEDGRFVTWDRIIPERRAPEGTAYRDSSLYQVVSSDGGDFEALERLPTFERWSYTWLGQSSLQSLPFGKTGRSTVSDDGLYYTSADRFEVLEFIPGTGIASIARVLRQPRPLSDDDISAFKAERMANAPDDPTGRESWQRWLDDAPYPPTLPTFEALLVDEAQNLWAEVSELPSNLLPAGFTPEWMVFGPQGRWYGSVVMPARFTPHDIGPNFVLGVWRDADDVEHVRLYNLIKPGD